MSPPLSAAAPTIGSVETLTPRWLEHALRLDAGVIEHADVAPVGTGQVASCYRITIEGGSYSGPSSIIAKGPSRDPVSRETGIGRGLYRREADWYQRYAAPSGVRCPRHLYSERSEADGSFVLLLEDCSPATQGDQLAGASIEVVRSALREAATLHGAFLESPEVLGALRTPAAGKVVRRRIELFQACWPVFRKRYAGRLQPDVLTFGELFAARYERYVSRSAAAVSVVHKDFRVDNMLFGGEDGRVVILDWQTYGLGHPMEDVAYLVGTSIADTAERVRAEHELVERYCGMLAINHPEVDLDEYWNEYRVQAVSGWAMAVTSSVLVEPTERGDEMFAVMAERSARQALDLDTLSML